MIDDAGVDFTTCVFVIVLDVEEPRTITFSPEEPEAGAQQPRTLADDDGTVTGASWRWACTGRSNGHWSDIPNASSASYAATVDDEDSYLRATVTYTERRVAAARASPAPRPARTGVRPSRRPRPVSGASIGQTSSPG